MKCLIYSYWHSVPVPPGARAGSEAMAAYAKRIGAEYHCDWHSPYMDRHGVPARWFDKLRPAFDPAFADCDRVLVCDHDLFPVDGLTENVFELEVGDFGMCEEPDQPEMRERFPSAMFSLKKDVEWARWVRADIPLDSKGRPRTWNAGLILFSRRGLDRLRKIVPSPAEYRSAALREGFSEGYCTEQAYLNALAFSGRIDFTPLDVEWNRQLHHMGPQGQAGRPVYDKRTPATKMVHVMFRGADWNSADWHKEIVNAHLHGTR